jgi:2-polyprenyl-3-methyl-5-hydroxy-6-metoxy-1,4-benzoquinol methylase
VNPLVRRALAAYDDAPRGVRFHTAVRARTCPFAELEIRTPREGRVLDVGCGHGLLALVLAVGSPARRVLGVDIDRDKLASAEAAARRAGVANITFEAVEPGWTPSEAFDAITVCDVLYLLGAEAAQGLLSDLTSALAPGGVVLVKEIDVVPRWKYQLARVQELVSTRVTRITDGEEVDFLPPAAIEAVLVGAGLAVEHVPLHRGRPHPHHLVVGRLASAAV